MKWHMINRDQQGIDPTGKLVFAYILTAGFLMFLLSSIKNYSYVITPGMDWNARRDVCQYLTVDFPAYIIDKGLVFAFTFAFAAIVLWNLLLYLFGRDITLLRSASIPIIVAWTGIAGLLGSEWLYACLGFCLSSGLSIAIERLTRRRLNRELSIRYPIFQLLLITMCTFFSLVGVGGGPSELVPLIVIVVALGIARYFFLKCRMQRSLGAFVKMAILSGVCSAAVFGLSFYDFDSGAEYGGAWRQLYYLAVFALLFQAYLMPALASASRANIFASRARSSSVWLAAGLSMVLPGLCAFSVHGVLVLITVPLLAVVACLRAVYTPYGFEGSQLKERAVLASLLLGTVVIMALDPIIAPSPDVGLLPYVPAASSAVGLVAISCTSRLFKDDDEEELKIVDEMVDAATGRSKRSCEVKAQLSIIASSVAWIGALVLYYALYRLTGSATQIESASAIEVAVQQSLVGIGGLYRFSWAVMPAVLSVFMIDACRAISIRFGKAK